MLACGDGDPTSTPGDAGAPDRGVAIDDGGVTDGGRTDGGAADTGGPAPDSGVAPVCEVDPALVAPRPAGCRSAHVHFLSGTVQSGGEPLADVLPQVCVETEDDRAACLPPVPTCEDGRWVREMPESFRCVRKLVMRMQKLSGGRFATTYCPIEVPVDPGEQGHIPLAEPYVLYPVDPDPSLPPIGTESEARTVRLADGVTLELTPSHLEFPEDYSLLGVRRLAPAEARPCFEDPALPMDALFAFTIDQDVFAGPRAVPLRIDNVDGLPAGTEVDLYAQSPLICTLPDGQDIGEGEWFRFGSATVSTDGQTIEGDPLPCLNWFGYRVRP